MHVAIGRVFLYAMLAATIAACAAQRLGGKTAEEAFDDPKVAALAKAGERGDVDEMYRLVKEGADVNYASKVPGEIGLSPLLWVTASHQIKAFEALLKLGANPNIKIPSQGEESVMAIVAGGNQIEQLELALKYGGNPNIRTRTKTALQVAVFEHRLQNIQLLMSAGADPTLDDGAAVESAANLGLSDLVAYFLDKQYDFNLEGLGMRVQISMVPPKSDQALWQKKVIAMLEARGIHFPIVWPTYQDERTAHIFALRDAARAQRAAKAGTPNTGNQ